MRLKILNTALKVWFGRVAYESAQEGTGKRMYKERYSRRWKVDSKRKTTRSETCADTGGTDRMNIIVIEWESCCLLRD